MKKTFLNVQILTLALLSVFFLACENPTEIGYDFNGTSSGKAYFSDTLTLGASTILSDSSVNGKANYLMAGITEDPILGKIKTTAFFQPSLVPGADGVTPLPFKVLPTAIADSVELRLINFGLIFGDTVQRQTFYIHRLNSSMNYSKNYNGDEGLGYESTPLTRFIINSRSFKNDTSNAPQAFYVKLPKALAEELIKIDTTTGKTKEAFNNKFRGFAIVPDNNSKGIYTFNTGLLNSATSTFITYWHYPGETEVYNYQFDLNGPRHTQVISDRSATALSKLTKTNKEVKASLTSSKTYVQGGTGIGTKVDFSNVTSYGSGINVSKATLSLKLDQTTLNVLHPQVFNFVVSELDANNNQVRNSSNNLTYLTPLSTSAEGSIASVDTTQTIYIDVTNFIQKLISKKTIYKSLLISPAAVTASGGGILSNDQIRRAVFLKPKLEIYYAK